MECDVNTFDREDSKAMSMFSYTREQYVYVFICTRAVCLCYILLSYTCITVVSFK